MRSSMRRVAWISAAPRSAKPRGRRAFTRLAFASFIDRSLGSGASVCHRLRSRASGPPRARPEGQRFAHGWQLAPITSPRVRGEVDRAKRGRVRGPRKQMPLTPPLSPQAGRGSRPRLARSEIRSAEKGRQSGACRNLRGDFALARRLLYRGQGSGRPRAQKSSGRFFMPQARTEAVASAVPNDLESFWIPFTPNRAFKK